jgi:hypothetical protein
MGFWAMVLASEKKKRLLLMFKKYLKWGEIKIVEAKTMPRKLRWLGSQHTCQTVAKISPRIKREK